MKKFLAILLSLCMLLSMVACGAAEEQTPPAETPEPTQEPAPTPEQETEPSTDAEGGIGDIAVDEGLLNVEITLPASFFEGEDMESIVADAKENGISECTVNEDGTVTYVMSKAKHKEMLAELAAEMGDLIDEAANGEDKVESFVSIDYNEDFSVIDIQVDPELYTAMDTLYALVFFMVGAYYQAFAGVAEEDIDIEVSFIDFNDGVTVLDASSYRTFMTNLEDAEEEPTAE